MLRFAIFPLVLLAASAQAATYRWVDEQGKVHYGDVMPSQQSGMGNVELDKQGRVVKETPRSSLSSEERRRQEEALVRREEARQKEEMQRRKDRALLTSYVSEREIDLSRDRALDLEEANIKGLKTRLNAAAEKLAFANGRLAQSGKAGQPPQRSLLQMRDEAQAELARIGDLIRQREQAREEIKVRFEADKLRFRELKANPPH